MIDRSQITGLILAGGQGRRMGHVDKGLQPFRGMPMASHVLMRLGMQADEVIVNTNQNLAAYESFGLPIVLDIHGDHAGPLAGIHAGLSYATTDYLITAPCDVPLIPMDLVERMCQTMVAESADMVVAKTGDQVHPVFCLMPTSVTEHLDRFLKGNGRKIDAWYASFKVAEAVFDDCPDRFINVNTIAELKALEARKDLT